MAEKIFNKELNVFNAFEFVIDEQKAFDLVNPYLQKLNNITTSQETCRILDDIEMVVVSPGWNGDIKWISPSTKNTFHYFEECFNNLDIAQKTQKAYGLSNPLILYSGYFVVRSFGISSHYHLDYNNEAGIGGFTVMIPIKCAQENKTGHLLYRDVFQNEKKYIYKKGKAIAFASWFPHSTEPF